MTQAVRHRVEVMLDVDVVVELIGGSDGIAREVVASALAHGKHVVTANKALLAHHSASLAALAEKNGVALNFEAAVAGAAAHDHRGHRIVLRPAPAVPTRAASGARVATSG